MTMPLPTYSVLEIITFSPHLNILFYHYSSIVAPKNTFLCTVTLTCLLLEGGCETTKKYEQN